MNRILPISILILLAAAPASPVLGGDRAPSTHWREVVPPTEKALFGECIQAINMLQEAIAKASHGKPARGFHAKSHGAMLAEFRVLDGIPAYARHGIFRRPRTYETWVRFSNGASSVRPDQVPDERGIGIKLMGVEGPRLPDGGPDARTQDFVVSNTPTGLARNGQEYFDAIQAGPPKPFFETLERSIGVSETLRIARYLAELARPVGSLTTQPYWTQVPLKLGPYACELQLVPVESSHTSLHPDGPNYLREDLAERLVNGGLRFDVFARFFVDEHQTPIEDGATNWDDSSARPVKLAELTIAQRDLATARARAEEAFGDQLSFTPWHALRAHRPLGNLMRMRRVVYAASAKFRGHPKEPTGRETF